MYLGVTEYKSVYLQCAMQRPSPKPNASQELEALNAIKKYNQDILKAREGGGGEDELPPPIPLKKKTSKLRIFGPHFAILNDMHWNLVR
jgi:hypothetical protein